MSRPKPEFRICNHEWHVNIKPKLDPLNLYAIFF